MSAMDMVPVALHGGPFDGHEAEVLWNPAGAYLFARRDAAGAYEAWVYRWADRSTAAGKRWVLAVDVCVSQGVMEDRWEPKPEGTK